MRDVLIVVVFIVISALKVPPLEFDFFKPLEHPQKEIIKNVSKREFRFVLNLFC